MLATRSFIPTIDRMLSRELDRVLTWDSGAETSRVWVPAMDVFETPEGYTIVAELPGLKPEQVEINFDRNVLTISGTKEPTFQAPEKGELRVFAAERIHGAFERSIRLPEHVDGDRIEATFNLGVLTITVPKAEAAKPRKITISAGGERTSESKQING